MRESECDVLIVGGGTGGCAAALAAASLGLNVVLTEETAWVGGQLTSQAVPPDEHPWIEQFGCTARYRAYRNRVRQYYREHMSLRPEVSANPTFNPGTGWVSNLCHEPRIGWLVLQSMLEPAIASRNLSVKLFTVPAGGATLSSWDMPGPNGEQPDTDQDRVTSVLLFDLRSGDTELVHAGFVLDATELGDLLALTGTEWVTGAEGREMTGEAHAPDGSSNSGSLGADASARSLGRMGSGRESAISGKSSSSQPLSPDERQGRGDEHVQAFTWVFAMGFDEGSHRVIDQPDGYQRWRAYRPSFWPNSLLDLNDLDPQTNRPRQIPLFSENWRCWFKYRQIINPSQFHVAEPPHPVTIVNWPQNDYFADTIIEATPEARAMRLRESRDLSLSLLYWLQTECPRPDGGAGYPGLYLSPEAVGTTDGLAMTPYIRESRRILARHTVFEEAISTAANPGLDRAPKRFDSVGVGAYRIDLHPSTGGDSYIDLSTIPFQIPLGSLVPIRLRNLLPACKNLGVTHITNGCYRLHPVEWNIGEASGLLAGFCLLKKTEPAAVLEKPELLADFQGLLRGQGVETEWPQLRPL